MAWLVEQLQNARPVRHKRFQHESEIDCLKVLDEHGGAICSHDVSEYYGCHRTTARNAIRRAVYDGILVKAVEAKGNQQAVYKRKP